MVDVVGGFRLLGMFGARNKPGTEICCVLVPGQGPNYETLVWDNYEGSHSNAALVKYSCPRSEQCNCSWDKLN